MLFQGEEFLTDSFFDDDEALDWDHLCEFQGVHRLFKDLIALRKSDDPQFVGLQGQNIGFSHFNQDNQIIAYERIHDDHPDRKLLIVVNFSNKSHKNYTVGLPGKGKWEPIFNSSSKDYDSSCEKFEVNGFDSKESWYDGSPFSGTFALPSYAAIIFTC